MAYAVKKYGKNDTSLITIEPIKNGFGRLWAFETTVRDKEIDKLKRRLITNSPVMGAWTSERGETYAGATANITGKEAKLTLREGGIFENTENILFQKDGVPPPPTSPPPVFAGFPSCPDMSGSPKER